MTESKLKDPPRIYVACLASYNAGVLHGRWIDCDQDEADIRAEIAEMLAESKEPIAEEYAIHDYENFAGITLGEYTDIATVARHADLLQKHGQAWAAYVEAVGEAHATEEGFTDNYLGEWESKKAYAEDWFRECHEIPETLEPYIDWDLVARDFFLGDLTSVTKDGKTFVFSNT